jgi:hypothetical protein
MNILQIDSKPYAHLLVIARIIVRVEIRKHVHAGLARLLDEGVDHIVRQVGHGVDRRRAKEHRRRRVRHVGDLWERDGWRGKARRTGRTRKHIDEKVKHI